MTVDAARTKDAHGHKLTFLPNLSQDLTDEVAPLKLSQDRLEEAIMEAATEYPKDKPLFEYLLACWKRVVRTLKALRNPTPQKEALLKEARRLCFSNCIFSLTMPELFRYFLSKTGQLFVWYADFCGCEVGNRAPCTTHSFRIS